MIGMVLVTHGSLADGIPRRAGACRRSAAAIETISDRARRRHGAAAQGDHRCACTKVDSGSGVVLLTDMFGGTPSNLAISVMDGGTVEVVAGINLPMLIKLASVRESASLSQAVVAGAGCRPQIHLRCEPDSEREMSRRSLRGRFRRTAISGRRDRPRHANRQSQRAARARDGKIRAMRRKIRCRDHGRRAAARRSAAHRSWAF